MEKQTQNRTIAGLNVLDDWGLTGVGEQTANRKSRGAKTNAARASHPSRIVRRPLNLPSRRLGQRDDGTGPTALTVFESATFTVTVAESRFGEPRLYNPRGGQQPNPAQRAGSGGGRNARATGTHSRASPIFPRRFTLENRRSAAGFTAIVVRQALKGPTYSVNPLCGRLLPVATRKHFLLVQKLWRMRLPCGRLRKSPEKIIAKVNREFNNLDAVKK